MLKIVLAMAAALTCIPASLSAQQSGQQGQPLAFPKWDIGGSGGAVWWNQQDLADQPEFDDSSWDARGDLRFNVGRYWSQHLKTEVSVTMPATLETYGTPHVEGVPTQFRYSFYNFDKVRIVSVTPSVTYQFFENAFAHPFVSGGVRLGISERTREQPAQTRTVDRVTYTLPASDSRTLDLSVRPVIGAGFKSYFTDRVFARPEATVTFGREGPANVALLLGFGIDF